MTTLDTLTLGDTATIVAVVGADAPLLRAMGLREGMNVTVKRTGEPRIVGVGNIRLGLGRGVSGNIKVHQTRQEREMATKERHQPTWGEIAQHISMVEGKPISRSRCQQVAESALKKLSVLLQDDPDVLDWARENNVEVAPCTPSK